MVSRYWRDWGVGRMIELGWGRFYILYNGIKRELERGGEHVREL